MCHRNWLSPCHGHIIAIQSMQWLPGCCRCSSWGARAETGRQQQACLPNTPLHHKRRKAGRASALADSIWRKDYLCADIPKLIRLWIIPGYRFWSGERPGQVRPISKQYREYRRWCQWTVFLIPQPRCYQRDIIRLFCGLCRCIDRNGVIHRRWIKTKLFL